MTFLGNSHMCFLYLHHPILSWPCHPLALGLNLSVILLDKPLKIPLPLPPAESRSPKIFFSYYPVCFLSRYLSQFVIIYFFTSQSPLLNNKLHETNSVLSTQGLVHNYCLKANINFTNTCVLPYHPKWALVTTNVRSSFRFCWVLNPVFFCNCFVLI